MSVGSAIIHGICILEMRDFLLIESRIAFDDRRAPYNLCLFEVIMTILIS